MDFAFSFEMWQSLCVCESENANGNARFAIAFGLCHNLCAHMWKTQLKIQFAIPFEKSPEYSSIESFISNDSFKTADSIETKQVRPSEWTVESLAHLIRSKTDSFMESVLLCTVV